MKKILIILVAALAFGCAREKRVVIVSTNDIHSSIDNFPRLATLVDSLRATGDAVLLVDGGDRWTGDPFVDLAAPPLSPIVELMNFLGYDLGVLGNHEFDFGQELLRERTGQMKFPVLGANVDGLGGVEPYKIVRAGGLRVAFLGLVTNFSPYGRPEGKAEHFEGLTFPDVFETAARWASLRDSADVFVALTHIGHDRDVELAERVPELDLIIGGDSHTVVSERETVGRTLITQTGSKLANAGVTTIVRRGKTLTVENRLVPLAGLAEEPRMAELVARIKSAPELRTPVGEAAEPFSEDGVGNLVADAIRAYTGVDAAFYHSGGVRIDTLAGPISLADIYRTDPFASQIWKLRMTAGQIKGLLIDTFNSAGKEGGRLDLIPSGMTYIIETNEAGEAVNAVLAPCRGAERTVYSVAVPDYLLKNYSLAYEGTPVDTGYLVTSILQSHIGKRARIAPDNDARGAIERL